MEEGQDFVVVLSSEEGDRIELHCPDGTCRIPAGSWRRLLEDPRVSLAIPVAIGDTTEEGGFPIVGTLPRYFLEEYAPKRKFRIRGEMLTRPFDAFIGSRVAQANGWDLGSTFRMVHGGADTGHVHNEEFTVVGVMEQTGTPNDKSVFVHLDGFYLIQGHDKPFDEAIIRERQFFGEPALSPEELAAEVARLKKKYSHDHAGHDHAHDDHIEEVPDLQKEVTSILVNCKTPIAANLLAGELKKGFKAMAVNPIFPMRQLMDDVLGGVKALLLVLTSLIIVVSGIGIFVSIYNSMSARQRAIGLVGLLLGHGLVFVAGPLVEMRTGLLVNPWAFDPLELVIFPVLIALGSLVGLLPGLTAYRTDVAEALSR